LGLAEADALAAAEAFVAGSKVVAVPFAILKKRRESLMKSRRASGSWPGLVETAHGHICTMRITRREKKGKFDRVILEGKEQVYETKTCVGRHRWKEGMSPAGSLSTL
jgi:hypothetical protein